MHVLDAKYPSHLVVVEKQQNSLCEVHIIGLYVISLRSQDENIQHLLVVYRAVIHVCDHIFLENVSSK